jgi:hypothetical protein
MATSKTALENALADVDRFRDALKRIADAGPTTEPDEAGHDDMESAFSNGVDVGSWEAAEIARAALNAK